MFCVIPVRLFLSAFVLLVLALSAVVWHCGWMAKQMLSIRIDDGLRGRLELEARGESRSVANMLEVILRERYASQNFDFVATVPSDVAVTVSGVQPRAHMKKNRPAVECGTRVAAGAVCPDCGAVG